MAGVVLRSAEHQNKNRELLKVFALKGVMIRNKVFSIFVCFMTAITVAFFF